jgi:hypothetical protein
MKNEVVVTQGVRFIPDSDFLTSRNGKMEITYEIRPTDLFIFFFAF